MLFNDRSDAGKQLVSLLLKYKDQPDTLVLGLARGGVVTAADIAVGLRLPLDVIVVRKIGAPGNEELAIGAIAERGEGIFNDELVKLLRVSADYIKKEVTKQKAILRERLQRYRSNAPALSVKNKTVILVDDGIATGASMRVAIASVREGNAKTIVLAVPVAAPDSLSKIADDVDEIVCLFAPSFFEAVGSFYRAFDQTTDEEVISLLLHRHRKS